MLLFANDFLSDLESVVTVVLVIEIGHLLLVDDLAPVNRTRLDLVAHLQEDQSIAALIVQIAHKAVLESQRIDPVAESALLSGARFVFVAVDGGAVVDEAIFRVEDFSNEEGVHLGVAPHQILPIQYIIAPNLLRIPDHHIAAPDQIALLKRSQPTLLVELVQNMRHRRRVGNILPEIANTLRLASIFEVMVDPADEDLFGLESAEIGQVLVFVLELEDLGAVFQIDGFLSELAGNLGQYSQDDRLRPVSK